MNQVKKAIILAAGMGKRMQPLTLEIPKPLVKVNHISMIETVIKGLHKNGIYEIYIVVGYKKEQFYHLKEKYNGIVFIENPYYEQCNNISSLYVARAYIENSIILDGDQIIYDPEILAPEFERSGYNCVWVEDYTEEWLLQAKNGIITQCNRDGGEKGWQLYSISRWNSEDGRKLRKHLEFEFDKNRHRDIYWDDIALFCYPEQYQLGIWPMKKGSVIEVDTLAELYKLDKNYEK